MMTLLIPLLLLLSVKNFNMLHSFKNQRGAIGILTTLLLSAVLVMMAVTVVLTGISSRANAFVLNESEKVFIATEGCTEEALIQLSRDDAYSGDNYTVDGVSCTVYVAGSGVNRNLVIDGTKSNLTRDISLSVQIDPNFGIIDWEE